MRSLRLRRWLTDGFRRGRVFVGCYGAPYARAAWASFGCVEALFVRLVGLRRVRFFDCFLDESVIAVRQVVSAFVAI